MPLELQIIESLLRTDKLGRPANYHNELWDSIDSTNTRCAALVREGVDNGAIVIARQQTAGRGRLGRVWVSPPDAGIYFSFLIKPTKPLNNIPLITLAAGLACAEAIHGVLGIKIGIKWVNDLILNGRKVGGILSERCGQAVVIGIGINIEKPAQEVPEELAATMTWLSDGYVGEIDRNLLLAELAYELEKALDSLIDDRKDEILNGWRKYAVTLGQHVRATIGDDTIEGDAIDINDSGALIVKTPLGLKTIHAGEVSVRRIDGAYT
jgi:BirA family transcriptional regulator, biotin operon repressor / biotin---[acetyl-CoA-carboxylase] ligase